MTRPRYLPDNFTLSLVGVVILASLFPCPAVAQNGLSIVTNIAIFLLFFLHGAKLSREALIASLLHWRLHVLILLSTFVLYPLLGLALRPVFSPLVTPALYAGVLFTCILPSTVQSSIALTSLAKGNVPAAVCSASASSMLGIFITPLLASTVLSTHGSAGSPLKMLGDIALQLLVPFLAGQLARRWVGAWIARRRALTRFFDQWSIYLVVYGAFSEAVQQGLWHRVSTASIVALLAVNALLLAIGLTLTWSVARKMGFSTQDRITIMFCGSKKSLASGVPMAQILFAGPMAGAVVLPLMLFHQMQLMVCSILAQRFAERDMALDDEARASATGAPPG